MSATKRSWLAAFAAVVIVVGQCGWQSPTAAQPFQIPKFEVDPSWAKLPSKWVWGQVSSVSIDERGHAWILQRPTTVRADQKDKAAPPVLETTPLPATAPPAPLPAAARDPRDQGLVDGGDVGERAGGLDAFAADPVERGDLDVLDRGPRVHGHPSLGRTRSFGSK